MATAKHIKNDVIPLFGVNTDPERSGGFLWDYRISEDLHKNYIKDGVFSNEELDRLMLSLQNLDHAKYKYRTRTQIDISRPIENKDSGTEEVGIVDSRLSINELILEENSGAKTCWYELIKDNMNLGILKSSGLIVSTGSGSTGLLLSARRPRISELCGMNDIINNQKESWVTVQGLKTIHDKLTFPPDSQKFYYFNRELCRNPHDLQIYKNETLMSLHQKEEGYCDKKLTIRNLNLGGHMLVDGNGHISLEYGDIVDVTIGTPLKWLAPDIIS